MIDEINTKILMILQEDARASNADIARQVGMAPSAVFERIRKMEAQGIIRGYEARLKPGALGLGLTAFIFVRTDERAGSVDAGETLAQIPEVQEVHHVAGEDCYLLKVRAADTEALGELLKRIGACETVRSTRTTIAFSTVKETCRLPLPHRPTPETTPA